MSSGSTTRSPGDSCVSAVVLAAGMATRMGRQKLLLPLDGVPMICLVLEAAAASRAAETIVVLGHESDAVMKAISGSSVPGSRVTLTVNKRFAEGMSTSVQAGIASVNPHSTAAVFLLGDQPYVTVELIDRLIAEFLATNGAIVRPVIDGSPANPVLIKATLFPELLAERGDFGGRRVAERHLDETRLVEIDSPELVDDIDSPEDYASAQAHS